MEKMRDWTRRGFTLVELLVVVLILGILMAIALPAFLSTTQKSKMAAAGTHARQIATAVQSDYVRGGGVTYMDYAVSPLKNDPDIRADLGGNFPDNPCSATPGLGGYTLTVTDTSWKIVPKNDLCPDGGPRPTVKLGN